MVVPFGMALLLVALIVTAAQPRAVRLDGDRWVADPGNYAGSEACRPCHGAIVEEQLAGSHARSLRDLSREAPRGNFTQPNPVVDPFTGARYQMRKKGGGHDITIESRGLHAAQKLHFEFGSGVHAYGYLGKIGDSLWLDSRLNYYLKLGAWDFTSGQDQPHKYLLEQPLGKPLDPNAVLRCFSCHSTVVRADGLDKSLPDGSGLRIRPDKSVLGVTCESCHGPLAEHVRNPRPKALGGLGADWSAKSMNQVCGRCHGISDVNPSHPVIARFQPWGLEQSRCFQASKGKLSCSSCHDPHQDARRDDAFYVARCQSCHSGEASAVTEVVCPVNRRSGCVTCHMPRDSKSMLNVSLTDHRIRVILPGGKSRSGAPVPASRSETVSRPRSDTSRRQAEPVPTRAPTSLE